VVKITKSIKTLILEIVGDNGPAHIKEVHLQVTEFRPDVPQHTIRARLSEMAYDNRNPFLIPIKHEYCLVFQKV
jgi:hypothetical protein